MSQPDSLILGVSTMPDADRRSAGDLMPRHPVQVAIPDAQTALARVAAVVPCFNRPEDVAALLQTMARLDLRGIDLRVLVVDNCSDVPLAEQPSPEGVHVTHMRLSKNLGGSGGYNAGMERVLGMDDPTGEPGWRAFDAEWVWLVDSDATVEPDTLVRLLEVMQRDDRIVAAGPAICDPQTGVAFEVGGVINRHDGIFEPAIDGAAGVHRLVECEYVAACCALVRADAVRCCGVMPDTFLNGDDVEWMIRLAQRTGGKVVGVPWARATHPRFDRFPTWTRYYTTRNALGPLHAVAAPRSTRFRRVMRDVARAVQQEMMGRRDLARLHMLGLAHAADGRATGPAPIGTIAFDPPLPMSRIMEEMRAKVGELRGKRVGIHVDCGLSAARRHALALALVNAGAIVIDLHSQSGLASGLARAMLRTIGPKRMDVAIVPARGRPDAWARARWHVQIAGEQCTLVRSTPLASVFRAVSTGVRGTLLGIRASGASGRAPDMLEPAYRASRSGPGESLSVEAIVLSYNRWGALERTVEHLQQSRCFSSQTRGDRGRRSITVVDNHSTDGTVERIDAWLKPRGVGVIQMDSNVGVEAFNVGVARSEADLVLILDDDATPDEDALTAAIDEMARRPGLGAITFHPKHPGSKLSEWGFADVLQGRMTDRWPVMGCANLVRRSAWNAVGGYEEKFFLYRNDADLALKLLGAGFGVGFDPALVAWHDTPAGAGASKSLRWHELATRNWIWMAKRHGRGIELVTGALLGWAWAHRLAGFSGSRHLSTLKGAWAGVRQSAPSTGLAASDGSAWRSLLRLRLGRKP